MVILSAVLAIFLFAVVFGIPAMFVKTIWNGVKTPLDSDVEVKVSKHSIIKPKHKPDSNSGVYGAMVSDKKPKK